MKAGKKVLGKHFINTVAVFLATIGAAGIILSGCSYSPSENEGTVTVTAAEEDTEVDILLQYSEASERAEYYYKTLNLSKANSFYRLVNIDGFSEEAATYALKHIGADWRQSALRRAKFLREEYSMTNTEIFYLLIDPEGENFTFVEADYAIANL